MHFINAIFALVAASAVMAAPAPAPAPAPAEDASAKAQVDCPNGWSQCGECNGTSCKVAGTDRRCVDGTSCTAQSGGGDGSICGHANPFSIDMHTCTALERLEDISKYIGLSVKLDFGYD